MFAPLGLGALTMRPWEYAGRQGFIVVTKDSDFNARAFVFGPPPKVVWIRRGNCSTSDIEALLRERFQDLLGFDAEVEATLLVLE